MTVQTSYLPLSYAGDNVTNSFAITWPFQLSSQIVANYLDVATSVTTPLVYGTDFTVTPISNSPAATGTVTLLLAPLPSGTDLLITRVTDLTQDTSWVANATNPSTAFENAVDKLTMIDQENAAAGVSITDAELGTGNATYSTFLRGTGATADDTRTWSNTLIGPLGPVTVPSDVQTVFEAQQNGAAAIKVSSGIGAQGSFRYAVDGDTNPWAAQWVYDPNIGMLGFQAYGGSIKGTFDPATGDASFSGTVNATLFTGAADASLITTGTIDPNRLATNSPAAGLYLDGSSQWLNLPASGGINTTTTGTFAIAAVASSQTVPVTSATGINIGNYLLISDGTHTIVGQVTGIASLNLTVKTISVILGSVGNTMASGAAVQLSAVPGASTTTISDAAITATPVSEVHLLNGSAAGAVGNAAVDLYISSIAGGVGNVKGYLPGGLAIANLTFTGTQTYPRIAVLDGGSSTPRETLSATGGSVLRMNSGGTTADFNKLIALSFSDGIIAPSRLITTNSLTDQSLFGYDSGTGNFKMFAPSTFFPGSGTTANFLRGDLTFSDTLTGNLNVAGTMTAGVVAGAADGSLITTGTVDVNRLGLNTPASNLFLDGSGLWSIPPSAGVNTTTTGTFVVAAVSSTQTVPVTSTSGIHVGTLLLISDGAHSITGSVTVIASLNLTVATVAINSGIAGNTMASGAAVQLGSTPGANTVQMQDAAISPYSVNSIVFAGNGTAANAPGATKFNLYISGTSVAPNAIVGGYIAPGTADRTIIQHVAGTGAGIIAAQSAGTTTGYLNPSAVGQVPICNAFSGVATTLAWGLIGPPNITPASLTPALLNLTNSLTDTYLFGYDSGTGHFKMFAPGISASGTTSQFINGAGTATNTLIAPGGSPAQLIFSDASTNQMILSGSGGFPGSISSKVGGVDNHQQPFDFLQPLNIGIAGTALIDTAGAIGSWATEGIIAQGWTRATGGNRSTAGYWDFITFVANPGTTYTADINTSAYFRFTALANNVVVTIKDTTPLPSNSSYRFAGELIIELVAPTGFDMTFAAFGGETITWAAGASAPTRANGQISNTGTNIFRFTRRQGITGWIGSVDNTVGTITGTGTVTSVTAGSGLTGGTITTSGTVAVSGVTGAMMANNTITATQISASANIPVTALSLPGGTTNFLRADGNWAVPPGSGGGGAFDPLASHIWDNTQTYLNTSVIASAGANNWTGANTFTGSSNTFTRTFNTLNSSVATTKLSNLYPQSLYQDANAIDITITDNYANVAPHAGLGAMYINHIVTARTGGGESIHHTVDIQSTTATGFNITHTNYTQARRMNGGVVDAVWLSTFSPDSTYAASNNPVTNAFDLFNSGLVRIGEFNYGNAWADFGRQDALGGGQVVSGPWLVPDWLGANGTNHHYNATFGLVVAAAGADFYGNFPKNWTGILINTDAIVGVDSTGTHANYGTGGYGANIHGGSTTTLAAASAVRITEHFDVGIDLSAATITTEWTSTHTNKAAILLASGQAICFKAPTVANTGVYIWFNGTNLVATKDGGNTTATII